MRSLPLILAMLCALSDLSAQIVNIEKRRLNDREYGWEGTVIASFAARRNTKNVIQLSTSGIADYMDSLNRVLIMGNINVLKSDDSDITNQGFAHLRYSRQLVPYLEMELFSQIQYNGLVKVRRRLLNGAGLRAQLTKYDNAQFYVGSLIMHETESLSDPDIEHRDWRLSSYFAFALRPQPTVTFLSTTYIQPRLDSFIDYRLLTENQLSLDLGSGLSVQLLFTMTYDEQPPIDVPLLTYHFRNGIKYTF